MSELGDAIKESYDRKRQQDEKEKAMENTTSKLIDDISEKTKGMEDFHEVREVLTDEEIVFYYIVKNAELAEIYEGEECIIKDILKVLGAKKYSVKHSLHLLDVAKEVLKSIARFEL